MSGLVGRAPGRDADYSRLPTGMRPMSPLSRHFLARVVSNLSAVRLLSPDTGSAGFSAHACLARLGFFVKTSSSALLVNVRSMSYQCPVRFLSQRFLFALVFSILAFFISSQLFSTTTWIHQSNFYFVLRLHRTNQSIVATTYDFAYLCYNILLLMNWSHYWILDDYFRTLTRYYYRVTALINRNHYYLLNQSETRVLWLFVETLSSQRPFPYLKSK